MNNLSLRYMLKKDVMNYFSLRYMLKKKIVGTRYNK